MLLPSYSGYWDLVRVQRQGHLAGLDQGCTCIDQAERRLRRWTSRARARRIAFLCRLPSSNGACWGGSDGRGSSGAVAFNSEPPLSSKSRTVLPSAVICQPELSSTTSF